MSQVDGAIVIKAKIDTKDAIAGSKDLIKHAQSLRDAVNSFGKDAKESSSAYVDMISNAANILSDLENTFFDIETEAQRVKESILDSGKVTNSYSELKTELEALTEEMKAFEEAGIQADALEYHELAENIRKVSEALNFQEGLASLQQLEDEYIELTQYVDLLKQTQLDSIDIHVYEELSEQIKNIVSAISKYYGENEIKKSLDEANESANQLNQRVAEGNAAVGADVKTEVTHFMTAAKEFFTATKEFQNTANEVGRSIDTSIFGYAKSTEQGAAAIQRLEDEFAKLKAQRDALVNERSALVSGGKMDNDQKELSAINEKIRAVEEELKRMERIKNTAVRLKPSFSEEWEQMPTLTGKAVEAFTKLKTAAQMTLYGMQHPLQSLNRALAVAADGAMKFAGSLTKAVFSGVVNTIKSIGSSAIRTAANLARMAGSGALSFLRRLAEGAKNAAVQLAKMVSSAVINGIKRLGSFAARAAKAVTNMGKSTDSTSLKDGLKLIIRYGFGVRSLFMLVRRLRSAIGEAFNNMAQKVPEVNETISRLASSLDRLKNSLATAFQPILTAVEPILTRFMDYLSNALTQVGMFFAALTGQDYVYKATKAQINYAESLDKTKKKAKEAENQLAGFDHLNILNDTSSSDSDSSANSKTPTSDFEKLPIDSKIFDFVQKLKEAFKNGQLYEAGKQFADFVNNFVKNTVKWEKIGRTLGKTINGIVDAYNGFMDNVDWEELGKGFGKTIDGLLDTVNWGELGRALSQKINALFGILWGIVQDENRWKKAGKALAEAVAGYFGNIKWDLIGKTIGTAINGIADLITEFATNFPWGEMGEKIRVGFENLVKTIDINKIYQAFSSLIKGILDLITPIITDTETWNKIASDFKTFLYNFFTDDELWAKAKTALIGGFRTLLTSLNTVFGDQSLFAEIGGKLADFLNSIMGDEKVWEEAGQLANNMMKDILAFGYKFLNEFDPETAAQNIQTAIDQIEWGNIASFTWKLVKDAFGKAGSFVDALFSENTSDLSGRALEEANAFNAKPLGERMALKFKKVFGKKELWDDIASTIWKAMQTSFTLAGDFIGTLLGVDTANMDTKERLEAIGTAIGDKLGEFANKVGQTLATLPWREILTAAFTIIGDVVKGLISGLLGDESGNGKVLLWIAGGFVALKAGIIPAIAKLIAGLASGFLAGGPALAAGITAALGVAAAAGIVKLADVTCQLVSAQQDLNKALTSEMDNGMANYTYLWKTYGEETANAYAASAYQIKLSGEDMGENLEQLGRRISEVQGTTFDDVETIVANAMGTYKAIVKTDSEEAAKEWALNALQIELSGKDTSENLQQLSDTIKQHAGKSKSTADLVKEACDSIEIEVIDTAGTVETTVGDSVENVKTTTSEAGKEIHDSYTTPYEGVAEEIKPNLDEITKAVEDATGDIVSDVESNMNEQSRVYDEKTAEMYKKASRHWNDIKSVQSTANAAMTQNQSSAIDEMARTDTTGHDSQYKEYYDHYGKIMYIVDTCMADAASYMKKHMDEMVQHAQNAMNEMTQLNWDYVGTSIVNGIARGINNGWAWLNNMVWNLAVSLFNTAKAALGIASPSKVFRDKIGNMIGLGIAEGIDDSGSDVVESLNDLNKEMMSSGDIFTFGVTDTELKELFDSMVKVSEQTQDEIRSKRWTAVGEYITDGIRDGIAENWNELENFVNDRIDSLYSSFNERLQAMADTVSFRMPNVAAGTVVPYSVQGGVTTTNTRDATAVLEQNNEELISVVIQIVNNAATSIVRAIQDKQIDVNVGDKVIGDASIREINRRTKAFGTSPLSI